MDATQNTPSLFDPIMLREVHVKNRVWLAPMCMYSCERRDGMPGVFHLQHLAARAYGGFGLLITEATAVTPEGRISPQDAGIWSDDHARAWAPIVAAAHAAGAAMCMQLAHAGAKASTYRGFTGEPRGVVPATDGGWVTVSPEVMSAAQIRGHIEAFATAAARADAAGLDAVEIHAAHGYLIHEFLSPITNTRTDEYGGSLDNRCRFALEVVEAIRAVWPEHKPVLLRISATDWLDDGWTKEESAHLAAKAHARGVDLVDVSSGGIAPADIPVAPGYQVPLAAHVRSDAQVASGAVGLITEPQQAQEVLNSGAADVILLGRAALREPNWPQRAAAALAAGDVSALYSDQYVRGAWPATS